MNRFLVVALPITAVFFSNVALAQINFAEGAYEDGKRLFAEGKTSEACKQFAASNNSQESARASFALASCHEKEGKFSSASVEFAIAKRLYAREGGKEDKVEFCATRIAELSKQIQYVRLSMPQRSPGVVFSIDGGVSVGDAMLTVRTPIDRGEHTLVTSAPGKKPLEQKFTIDATKAETTIEIAALEAGPTTPGPTGTGVVLPPPGSGKRIIETEADHTKRTVGFIVGGTGILLGIGALVTQFGFIDPAVEKRNALNKIVRGEPEGVGGTNFTLKPGETEKVDGDPSLTTSFCGNGDKPASCTYSQYIGYRNQAVSAANTGRIVAISLGIGGAVALGVGIVLVATSGGSKQIETTGKRVEPKGYVTPFFTLNSAGLSGTF
jgi:hypothetical protein